VSNWLSDSAYLRRWQRRALAAIICCAWLVLPRLNAVPNGKLSAPLPHQTDKYTYLTNQPSGNDLSNSNQTPQPVAVVNGEVLVRFRPNVQRVRQQSVLDTWASSIKYFRGPDLTRARAQHPNAAPQSSALDQLVLVRLSPGVKIPQAIEHFRKQPDVLYAEPNYRLQIAQTSSSELIPNDFDFAQLWGLHNVGQADGTPGADIHAPEAWETTTGDRRIVVAVIDTGVDYYHPDLADNIWSNPKEVAGNGLDDDGNGFIDDVHGYDFVSDDGDPMDDHGHGSHVSGTIGGVGNNQVGIAGVCWQVSLMAVKIFDETGNGSIDTAIEGIRYAIENGANIINASWGSTDKSNALEDGVNEAYQAGVLFVAAAGNNNSQTPFYPAAYEHAFSVAATDAHDKRSRFSNYGTYIQVGAPGENIYSTLPNNSYEFYSGTSMATPHVSGVAALILARHPDFTNDQLANILRNSVDTISTDQSIGSGRINAALAVRVNVPLPQVKLSLPDTLSGDVNISGTAAGNDFVSYLLEYGQGSEPTNWTAFYSSDTPVPNGTLFPNFSTPPLGEGPYTFRLTARNASGEQAVERAAVQISNVHITYPMHDDILRAGDKISITGTAFGGNRMYRVQYAPGLQPTNWSDVGVELTAGGTAQVNEGVLATWDTSLVSSNQFYSLKLTATAPDGTTTEFITQLVYLDSHLKAGWPQYIPIAGDYPIEDWRDVTVADIDNDGLDEIIIVDHGNSDGKAARLLVYRYDGSLLWSKELASGYPYSDIPLVGDIDGDGFKEIFVDVGSSSQLFAFRHDGTPLPGNWPVHLEATSLGKVLADLAGDGNKELIGYSQDSVTHGGTDYRQLVVFDKSGNLLRKWEVPACDSGLDAPKMFPAVGNLDGDPELEIVAVSGCDTVAAFKLSHGSGPIWSTRTFGTFVSSPVIGDLDHNGTNEIVIAAFDMSGGHRGGVYAFDNRGRLLPGWPVLLEESFSASPALADVLGDGQLEISLPSWKSKSLHLLRRDGFEVPGWPVGPVSNASLRSSVVVGDVDGDGQVDIVLSSPGHTSQLASNADLSQAGGIKAWNAAGQQIALSGPGGPLPLLMESSSGDWAKAPPLTLADIDHNGKLDVIAATIRDRTYLPFPEKSAWKNRSSLYVWELDRPYVPDRMPWPMFQGGPERTGYLPSPKHPDQPPIVGDIPSQIIPPGDTFFRIQLDQYVEDPDNRPSQISWHASGNQQLQVLIDSNRVATIELPASSWVGVEAIRFTARDPGGLESSALVSFEVRVGYVPPHANPDQAVTAEDTPVEIDVLSNDSDPGGNSLIISSYSKPLLGTVTRTPRGTLLYSPARYARGTDSFSYVVINGQGGMAMASVSIQITPVNHPPNATEVHAITDEDSPVDIDILGSSSDPDGDPISLLRFSQPQNGAVSRNSAGTLRYVPKTYYFGEDSLTYVIADPFGATNQGTVTIMVKPVNHPPQAQSQDLVLNRNSSINITFTATDPDPGDTQFTFTVLAAPQHGTLWNYPTVATYYPTNGFSGSDSFTYKANDGKEDGPIATVRLTVLDVNNPPQGKDQTVVTKVNQPVAIHLSATDLDDDPLVYRIVSTPVQGSLTGSGTNYVYTPKQGYLGKDAFTYQAFDGKDYSQIATVSLTVTDQNTAPVAEDFAVQVSVNAPTNIALRATDLESDPLSFKIVSRPINGKLSGKGAILLYSPNVSFTGSDRFTFQANDGQLDSNVGTVSIDVESANHAPVTTNQQIALVKNTPVRIQLSVTDTDGDTLNCPILKGPQHGLLSGLGTTFTYTPKLDYVGNDSFTYKAWDGHIYSHEATVMLTVALEPPKGPPAFQSVEVTPDGQVRLVLVAPMASPVSVLVSTNLLDWAPLGAAPNEGSATRTFVDHNANPYPARFYRAEQR
jgi:subtilisin family serine protease